MSRPRRAPAHGQPATGADELVVAIDVDGSQLSAGLIDAAGHPRLETTIPTPEGPQTAIAAVRALARRLAGEAGAQLRGVGVAVPGIVDREHGVVRHAANLGWQDVPLRALLAESLTGLDVPLVVEHDVRAAAHVERALGAAAGVQDCCIVIAGTGVAAVSISGGRLLGGASGAAGELGHVSVVPDGDACGCGRLGCLEAYASTAAIARRYALASGRSLSAANVLARRGVDAFARHVWGEAVQALSTALAGVVMLTDPELIVVTGGLADVGAELGAALQAALDDSLTWRDAPRVSVSPHGARVGRTGAALLAWQAAGGADAGSWHPAVPGELARAVG